MQKLTNEYLYFEKEELIEPFVQAVLALDRISGSFSCLTWLFQNEFLYISKEIETILGHPHQNFERYGLVRFQHLIPEDQIHRIYSGLDSQLAEMEKSDESIFSNTIFKMDGAILDVNKVSREVLFNACIMDVRYTEIPSYLMIGTWTLTGDKSAFEVEECSKALKKKLLGVKHLYIKAKPEHFKVLRIQKQISAREKEVACLIAEGLSTKAISERLNISFNTVETHRKNLLAKLEAKNSAELIYKVGRYMNIN